jgi:hypothetical protein
MVGGPTTTTKGYTQTLFKKPWSWNIVWRGLRLRHCVFFNKNKKLKNTNVLKIDLKFYKLIFFHVFFFMWSDSFFIEETCLALLATKSR